MTLYNVMAIVATEHTEHGVTWHGAIPLPTFVLDGDIQGLLSEAAAERFVRTWMKDFKLDVTSVSVSARPQS